MKTVLVRLFIFISVLSAQPNQGRSYTSFVDNIDLVARLELGVFNLIHTATRLQGTTFLGLPVQSQIDFKTGPLGGVSVGLRGYDAELLFSYRNNFFGKIGPEAWFEQQNGNPIYLTKLVLIEKSITSHYFFSRHLGIGFMYKSYQSNIKGTRAGTTLLEAPLEQTLLYLYLPVRYKYKGLMFHSNLAISIYGNDSENNKYEAWFIRYQTSPDYPDPIASDIYLNATGKPRSWFIEIGMEYTIQRTLVLHVFYLYESLNVRNVYSTKSSGFYITLGIPG